MRIFINGAPHQTDLSSMSYERLLLTLGKPLQSVMTVGYSYPVQNGVKTGVVMKGRFFNLHPNMQITAVPLNRPK